MSFGAGFGGYRRMFRSPLSPRAEMNQEAPVGCLLMVIVPILVVVSTYLAWWELRFFLQGRTTEATVVGIQELRLRRSYRGSYLEVRYSFQDDAGGPLRTEHDDLPLSWPHPDKTVRVEYVRGVSGGSRVAGHRHIYSTIFFAVSVITAVVYGVSLVRDARRAVGEEEAFEASRRRHGDQ
jgi:hypothetical protein